MSKYQALIKKIQNLKTSELYSNASFLSNINWNFSPAELELIQEALETIQFLEIVFKARSDS